MQNLALKYKKVSCSCRKIEISIELGIVKDEGTISKYMAYTSEDIRPEASFCA